MEKEHCKHCMAPQMQLDVNHMMADLLGEGGISRQEVNEMAGQAARAFDNVRANRGKDMLEWTELPYNQEETVAQIEAMAAGIRKRFDAFVVLGIGGSALGPIAVQQALNHMRYNELPADKRPGPRFYVEDNIDPERFSSLLDVIDVSKTCFNVITKSGGTAETMSQYLLVTNLLQQAVGENWREHVIATTDREKGNLIRLARENGLQTLFVPTGVGGRFSELSPVGLLPAAVCGIDIRGLLHGAKCMDTRCRTADVWQNPALLEAVLQIIAMRRGFSVQVVMPYADSLKYMADWFAQLWAESLGKRETRQGKPCNAGQTPVKALGVTDQHSQLQLYTEGPRDKVVTFLRTAAFRQTVTIPHGCEQFANIAFLGGKTLNQLLEAERQGTEYALFKAGRMSQTITLPGVNAMSVGQLLYFFEMVTAYAGELLDINAFNQPGVEESKDASYAVLGNPDEKYRDKQREMAGRPGSLGEYVL